LKEGLDLAKKKNTKESIDSIIANENIVDGNLKDEIELSMLSYSVMTIIDRALPDVRDGMKPVQRRILYCCKESGFEVTKPYVKCAKIAGAVSGNYHPHGSCYGTIANMSQPWTYRYPLIDFHGNNGSLDGDGEAADRYTEGRLAKASYEILEDVMNKHSVEFQPNYSETATEPKILPALFPNFLLNGASGIAVGYTTNVPSHNLKEVCDGIIYAIQHKDFTVKDLMKYIKGPDLPYGSSMLNKNIDELYTTGQAHLEFRANYVIEQNEENGNPQIVFIDLPPESKKPALLEKIHELIVTKALPRVICVRDESKGMDIRVVVECQKTANIPLLVKDLYAKTQLQKKVSYIIRGVVDKTLKLVTLDDYMDIYINHRRDVIKRRTEYTLDVTNNKLNQQLGLTKVIDDIKNAVNIIIDSETDVQAKQSLMEKYKLNEEQANFILDKKVRTLVKLDRDKIFDTIKEYNAIIDDCKAKLADEILIDKEIISQLEELKNKFGDKRRTKIVKSFDDTVAEANVSEDVVCVLNKNGLLMIYEEEEFNKFIESKTYKEKSNVFIQYMNCKRSEELIIINRDGTCERVPISELQYNNIKFDNAINFIKFDVESKKTLISVLKNGNIKKTFVNKMKFKQNKPTQLIKDMNSEIVVNKLVNDTKDEIITIASNNGFIGRFSCNSFVATASGAKAMTTSKLDDGDFIVDCKISSEQDDSDNKLLMIYLFENDTYGYKTMNISDLLVKGRSARALSCVAGKKFKQLSRIYISKDDFIMLNDKNKEVVFNKYKISKRSDKCNETKDTFKINIGQNDLIV
jgi:DNA gyrase subunit A